LAANGATEPRVRNFFTVGAALSIGPVKMRLRPANRDGARPAMVRRWLNLNAHGDVVGGPLQGRPYEVDSDFPNLDPFGCRSFLGLVNPQCAHGSYFVGGNDAVNRDIFAEFIDQA
jgi:metacaspase-1